MCSMARYMRRNLASAGTSGRTNDGVSGCLRASAPAKACAGTRATHSAPHLCCHPDPVLGLPACPAQASTLCLRCVQPLATDSCDVLETWRVDAAKRALVRGMCNTITSDAGFPCRPLMPACRSVRTCASTSHLRAGHSELHRLTSCMAMPFTRWKPCSNGKRC